MLFPKFEYAGKNDFLERKRESDRNNPDITYYMKFNLKAMNETLLKEANTLYTNLTDLLWQSAIARNKDRWLKLERISGKALNRYERRYNKWEESQRSNPN